MFDAAAAPVAKTPKKKASKHKAPAAHTKYNEMVKQAITSLKERGGSSRQAILKYIMKNFNVGADEKSVNSHLKLALRAGVKNNSLKQSKCTGASGSFRLGAVTAEQKPKKKVAKKPAATKKPAGEKKAMSSKPKTTKKKAAPKKAKATKPKSPKMAAAPKKAAAAKKPAAKKPAAKKPAAKKSAAKKAAAKK